MKRILKHRIARIITPALFCLFSAPAHAAAVDSYRFMHVSVGTLWNIFLFLLCFIFLPFVLMVVFTWRNAARKAEEEEAAESEEK